MPHTPRHHPLPLPITSRANDRVRRIARLRDRAGREGTGMFWAEGRRCVEAALALSHRIDEIAVRADALDALTDLVATAHARGCPVVVYDAACFSKFTAVRHPDGIGAVVRLPDPCRLPSDAAEAVLMLWQMQDPGNQGSIIRSAAAMGVHTIVTVAPCVDALHPLCVRATAGQVFAATLVACSESEARLWLEARAADAAVLTADGGEPVSALGTAARVLVIGGEARGVPDDLRARMASFAIPMASGIESLNANAAAAIGLYAWRTNRQASRHTE